MLLGDNLAAKRKVVEKIGWNVLLKDKKLYDVLLKPQYRTDLRRGWDSNPQAPKGNGFQDRPDSHSLHLSRSYIAGVT